MKKEIQSKYSIIRTENATPSQYQLEQLPYQLPSLGTMIKEDLKKDAELVVWEIRHPIQTASILKEIAQDTTHTAVRRIQTLFKRS